MNALFSFVETFKLNSREHQLTGFTARAASCSHNEHGAAEEENEEHDDGITVEAPDKKALWEWLWRRWLWTR